MNSKYRQSVIQRIQRLWFALVTSITPLRVDNFSYGNIYEGLGTEYCKALWRTYASEYNKYLFWSNLCFVQK